MANHNHRPPNAPSNDAPSSTDTLLQSFRFLSPLQIKMIDEALISLGDYGEVRLIVEKGSLRFVVTQKSYDAHKWQPGCLIKDLKNT
jgi:hypothetical protein